MNYHNITKDDLLNGDGIRVVLWVSGCNHYCPGCQNPVTWDPNDGLEFNKEVIDELFEELKKKHISGVTFSGGDPFYPENREYILALAAYVKQVIHKTVWMYTGYSWEEIKDEKGMDSFDVIVDGEYVESLRDTSLKWRGSSNQRVIDVKKSLETGEVVLWCD
jgi:anaerobic ribonucleoside-triphosphate reductase activating protein